MPSIPSRESTRASSGPAAVAQSVRAAFAAYERGEWAAAEDHCRSALAASANCCEALHLLGAIAAQRGRPEEAAGLLARALAAKPDDPMAHNSLGNVLRQLGRFAAALEAYDRALALAPDFPEAHNNRGAVLRELRRPAEALKSHESALSLRSDYAEAHSHRGNALRDLNRSEEALESYQRALALKPRFAGAWNNRSLALRNLDRHAEALESCERALALEPALADAHNTHGNLLRGLGRPAEALESYRRALALRPDFPAAHYSLGQCLLLLGDLVPGWKEYEWRWKEEQQAHQAREFAQPLWLGGDRLKDRTILLHSEQGLGDTLQFCRYASRVAALGATVLLEVQPPLLPLLAGLPGVAQLLPRGAPLPAFDCHCPLLSLPLAFGTRLDSIPADVPYLRTDPKRVATWRDRLGVKTRMRVGLAWSGSPTHRNDRNRSVPFAQMLPLLDVGLELVSLQKEVRAAEAALLASRPNLRHFSTGLADFAETAALIETVDLIVTVDTSVAHLAAALGKPVWVLLPFDPDWRWLLARSDSPWYPTVTLFRQPHPGDWASIVAELVRRLEATVHGTSRATIRRLPHF